MVGDGGGGGGGGGWVGGGGESAVISIIYVSYIITIPDLSHRTNTSLHGQTKLVAVNTLTYIQLIVTNL